MFLHRGFRFYRGKTFSIGIHTIKEPAMKRFGIFIVITFGVQYIGIVPLSAQMPGTSEDRKSIDTCTLQLYRLLSYQNGNLNGIDSISLLFVTGAKLTANFAKQRQSWTVPEFILFVKEGYSKQSITGRAETELFERTDLFGNIGQRFSTYQIHFTVKGKTEIRKGINAIQFLKVEGKWLINSLVWDVEKPAQQIPAMYTGEK